MATSNADTGNEVSVTSKLNSPYNTALSAFINKSKALKGRETEQRTANVQMSPSTRLKSRSVKKKHAYSEHVCLYQNSSTLQIIHRVPKNQEKCCQRNSKLRDRASDKLGSKSTSRH